MFNNAVQADPEVLVQRVLLRIAAIAAASVVVSCGGGDNPTSAGIEKAQAASGRSERASPPAAWAARFAVPEDKTVNRLDARLHGAKGPVSVWVQLDQNSVAAQRAALAEAAGITASSTDVAVKSAASLRDGVRQHRERVRSAQSSLASRLSGMGARELGRVQVAHNAIAVSVDASQLKQIAAMDGVAKVRPVLHYQLALSETVPYIGAAAVQASGRDGTGVRVAVLDSGIDYTHRNLGGPGTLAAYAAAYGANEADPKNTSRDGLFPTAKVVDGYDFVGETWGVVNNAEVGTRTEDPDPIDRFGHGTHVADIIAGKSLDGTHKGVAPGASLVAVKVCSAVTTSCNGVALLKGMDFALDPNGDGDTSDAVDVINMSLGSDYGQVEDDLTLAASDAVKLGVVVVTAAGNAANKPYIVSSPSIGEGVISVAQTQVPSAKAQPLVVNAPAAIAGVYGNTATVDWAPIGSGVSGDVAYVGRGCPAGSIATGSPEDPYRASPTGKIALIDRGACSVSLKVDRAVAAGATGVIIGLVAAGDAVSFSNGGGTHFAPTIVIQQSLSTAIKAQLAGGQTVNVSMSPASAIALVGSMASTSSRGPSISAQGIKPEIGAPGASVSAVVGSGNREEAFGGTSGATPMVAGSAALLLQAFPNARPEKIKAMLMNSAETAVYTNPAVVPGELAPITRIGAGEVRVNRAIALTSFAWNRESKSAALAFGALEVAAPMVVEKTLRVENFSANDRTYNITPSFRYADDQASGAVRVLAPSHVHVPRRGREDITVRLLIDPSKLPTWQLNGGSLGGNGAALNGPEYDGYLTLTAGSEKLSVPWHVLPRKAAATIAAVTGGTRRGQTLQLLNLGAETGDYDVFSLTGTNKRLPSTDLPQPGDNFAAIDLRAVGVRHLPAAIFGDDYLEFAFNTFGRRAHPNYPAEFDVVIDVNGDGTPDFVVYNAENGGFGVSGQNVVNVVNLATGAAGAVSYTDVDLNSGNVIFTVPMAALGLSPGTTIGFSVGAFDNYFTGALTDSIDGMRFTPGAARYGVDGDVIATVPPRSFARVGITSASVPDASNTELGLLLMYRRHAGREADLVRLR